MAEPDPHMEELRIMSYEPRHRACKQSYMVPKRNDFIEILWCMDHLPSLPNRWCPAEVLHITSHPDQDIFAKGVILYLPGDIWEEQVEQVEFLDKNRLRCVPVPAHAVGDCESDGNTMENRNPPLEWRFRPDPGYLSDGSTSDCEWEGTGKRKRTTTADSLRKHSSNLDRDAVDRQEMQFLRAGHANVVIELERLRREMSLISRSIAKSRREDIRETKCVSANCVLPRLRQKVTLKMQAGLRQATRVLPRKRNSDEKMSEEFGAVDGLHRGILRVRVECTLQQFENVARQIRARSCSDSVYFFPDFSFTQLPLRCSCNFRILFRTFSHLCDTIGIVSAADKKEMARKCGKASRGELLRMLGTYEFDEDDVKKPCHFHPATSAGSSSSFRRRSREEVPEDVEDFGEPQSTSSTLPQIVFSRKTREWDKVEGRYLHCLRKESAGVLPLEESSTELQAFALSWNRAAEVTERAWSDSLCMSDEVFGWLQISLPFIQAQGRVCCQELGANVNDDVWDLILGGNSDSLPVK